MTVEAIAPEPAGGRRRDRRAERARDGARAWRPSHIVRVDLTRLDELMRMIGDLVISRARLDGALGARRKPCVPPASWRAIQENTQAIERQLRDLREGVMRVRLVPVGEIFRRMPFVVRDLARETGKQVRLELRGQDTEIDKFLIERMMDPVLHLVRNAVSHGFEPPAERVAAGKPEEGTLTLAAASVGEAVVLEIADDGRGIDAEAVAARARALGLPLPDGPLDAATLLDDAVRAGVLDARRNRSRQRPRRRHGGREDDRRGAERHDVAADGARRGHAVRHRAAADAGDHRRADRPRRRPRRSRCRRPRCARSIEIDPAAVRQIEEHEIAPYRGGALPIVRLGRLFGIAGAGAPRAPRLRRRHGRGRGRHRRRSHRRPARDRRARHGRPADQGGRRRRARPISATAASC